MSNNNYPIPNDHRMFKDANNIEEVLCLAALISAKILDYHASLIDSRIFWEKLDSNCSNCPIVNNCLASIINE